MAVRGTVDKSRGRTKGGNVAWRHGRDAGTVGVMHAPIGRVRELAGRWGGRGDRRARGYFEMHAPGGRVHG
jgi:hypothetical protein